MRWHQATVSTCCRDRERARCSGARTPRRLGSPRGRGAPAPRTGAPPGPSRRRRRPPRCAGPRAAARIPRAGGPGCSLIRPRDASVSGQTMTSLRLLLERDRLEQTGLRPRQIVQDADVDADGHHERAHEPPSVAPRTLNFETLFQARHEHSLFGDAGAGPRKGDQDRWRDRRRVPGRKTRARLGWPGRRPTPCALADRRRAPGRRAPRPNALRSSIEPPD